MGPFGCPVNILNTLDPLGKFDRKADEGFFVRYSINSKAFRVFKTRTRKVEENLHITFLENKPNIAGSGPDWLFDIDLLPNSMNYEPVTTGNQTNKNAEQEEALRKQFGQEIGRLPGQGEATNTNSINRVNTVSSSVNVVSSSFTIVDLRRERAQRNEFESVFGQDKDNNGNSTYKMFTPVNAVGSSYENLGGSIHVNATTFPNDDFLIDPLMPNLKDTTDLLNTGIFSGAYDAEDVGAEDDLNNLETTMNVTPIPTTRIHKDHPKDQIIGDINLATQTRMIKMSEEHAMVSYINKKMRTNHKDYQKCLFAYFLSQIEPKKVIQALIDPSWIEAMQEELLQFKLQKMDVKSAFLYGTIEEEVYVCQPPGFEDPQFLDKVYKVEKALYGLHQALRACSMGELTFFLRLQVQQKEDGIFVSQDKYVADILKKFNFVIIKTASTPIETNKALLKDEKDEDVDVDVYLYRSMIGSLMYLTASRPDIMFAICACARFQVTLKVSHLYVVKRIFRYLKEIHNLIEEKVNKCSRYSGLCMTMKEQQLIDEISSLKLMSNLLLFVDQHNIVACLERTEENAEFHQIVDFLTTSSIYYALTQIHAIIDGKTVVVSKSSVRSDLHFNDEDVVVGGEGSGQTSEPQPPSSTTQPIIEEQIPVTTSVPIPNVADEAVFKERDDRVVWATTTAASLDAAQANEKQLGKEEFQETESMDAFRELKTQFQLLINFQDYFDYFNDGPIIQSSGTESEKHDTSNRSRNDTYDNDVDIKPVNDKEPIAEVQLIAEHSTLSVGKSRFDSNTTPDSTNMSHRGGEIDQDAEQYQVKSPLLNAELFKTKEMIEKETYNELSHSVAKLLAANEQLHKENKHLKQTYKELYDSIKKTCVQNKDNSDSLISQINQKSVENADLKAQIQEKVFANAALKNELRKLKGTSVDTKFAKSSILGKPVLQPHRHQLVVRQPTAFKSERSKFSKPRFASQVDVINVLPKPVTPHYLPKVRESVFVKPHHVIASGSSRNSSKESYGSNDMTHKYYLEEAKKKTQKGDRNSKPSRILLAFKTLLMVQSPKTRNNNKTVVPKSHTQKPGRQITIGQRFSPKKSSAVHEKPNTPRSCLRWIPTGRIFKLAGLRWIPTGKTFIDSTTKVDSEPSNGSNEDITNPYECDQTLNVSAGTLNLSAVQASLFNDRWRLLTTLQAPFLKEKKGVCFSALYLRKKRNLLVSGPGPQLMTPRIINSGLVQNIPSPTPNVPPTKIDWDSLFQPMFDEYFKPPPNVDHLVPEVPTPVPSASTSSPSSTTVDQDEPSISTSQTTSEQQSSVIPQGVEDDFCDIEVADMDNDPYFGILIPEPSSEETTLQGVIPSNLNHLNQSFDTLTNLTKKYPLENVIGDPSRSVSTRSQLQEHTIWCYFDANDNPIPFGGKWSG
ncbi:ribonuclease H-like domain-containing protein [Tanacetum coccineum]